MGTCRKTFGILLSWMLAAEKCLLFISRFLMLTDWSNVISTWDGWPLNVCHVTAAIS